MAKPRIEFDPVTRQWVFPDGRRLAVIAGGSAMFPDDTPPSGGDDIEVDDPTKDDPDPDDDEPDDDDDDRRQADDGYVPPDKITWDKMRAAVKNQRREIKILKREYEAKVQNLTSTASATNEVEVEKARIKAEKERDAYWTEEIVRAKAAAEFTAQGADAHMAERLALMVNLKKVDWDEREREFDGLQDEIDDIVEGNPDFFKPKNREEEPAPRRGGIPRPRVDGAGRASSGGAPRKKPSSAQLLANQALTGNTRGRRR